jgi:hypothetical protein
MIDTFRQFWDQLPALWAILYLVLIAVVGLEILPRILVQVEIPEGVFYLAATFVGMVLLSLLWPLFFVGWYCYARCPEGSFGYPLYCWRSRHAEPGTDHPCSPAGEANSQHPSMSL